MNTKISEAAVEAGMAAWDTAIVQPTTTAGNCMRLALEAALPHLQGEAVPVACLPDYVRSAISGLAHIAMKDAPQVAMLHVGVIDNWLTSPHPQPAELSEPVGVAPEQCAECGRRTFHNHPDGHICLHCKLIVGAGTKTEFALDALVAAGHVEQSKVDQALAIGGALAATGKQQVGEVQGDARERDGWRVGEFRSSADPGKVVLCLSEGERIASDEAHHSFIRWVAGSDIAARQPVGTVPPGMVMVQIADAERLCSIGKSFGQHFDLLPVKRVRALIDGRDAGAGVGQ